MAESWKDEETIWCFEHYARVNDDEPEYQYAVYAESEAQAWELLAAYLRQRLPAKKRKNFARHLRSLRYQELLVFAGVSDFWSCGVTHPRWLINRPEPEKGGPADG